jgi:hypothetical protein
VVNGEESVHVGCEGAGRLLLGCVQPVEESVFHYFQAEITDLDYNDHTSAGRKAAKLTSAVEQEEQYQQMELALQIRKRLADVQTSLQVIMAAILLSRMG